MLKGIKFKKTSVFLGSIAILGSLIAAVPAEAASYNGFSGTVDCSSGGSVLIENNIVVPRTQYVYDPMEDFGYQQNIPSDCSGSVVIPENVTSISSMSFEGAGSVTSITLPSTLTKIDSWAFYGATALTSLTIPAGVTSIGGMVFGNTNSLTAITVNPANQNYSSIDGVLYDKNVTRLLKYPSAKPDTSFEVPNTVTVIDYSAAIRASALTSLTIPASVTLIAYFSFEYASSLKSIYFMGNSPTVEYRAFGDVASGAKAYIKSGSTGFAAVGNAWNGLTVAEFNPQYSVKFNSNGGTDVTDGSFNLGGSVTAPAAPTRSGYTFVGWSASNGGSAVSFPYSPGVTSDVTLYALWAANSFTVTFDSNCDQYVSPGSFVFDGSVAEPVAPRLTGYTFLGWSATDGGDLISFPYFPGVASNIVLYAKWAHQSFTVNFVSNGGSSVDSGSVLYHGSIVAPAAPTRSGYTFVGWSASNGGSAVSFPYSPGVTSDVTLYAKWAAKTYVVTYNSKGGSTVSSGTFTTGGSVVAAPKTPARSGYTFVGWSATDGGSPVSFPYSPGVSSAVTLYAKWSALPPLMGFTSASTLLPGASVSINISRVNQGCTVNVGWTDSSLGINPVSRVIKADRTTGVFSIATPTTAGSYTLSTSEISAECAGGSAITLTQTVVVGKSLSITAKVVSSSGYASKSPVFSVTGTVKSGSAAVSGKQVSVSLRRNGVEVKTTSGTTSSTGVLNVSFAGTTYVAGDFTAVITGVSDSTYLAAQVTTAKLTLR